MIEKELMEVLVCTKCHAPVREETDRLVCTNPECGLRYPIRDGIPSMLITDAEQPPGAAE
jgi:uncharacterized protein YbaR (Trm112 family)